MGGRGLGSRRERVLDAVLAAGGETAGAWCEGAGRQGEREITLSLADLLIPWMMVLIQNILTNLKPSTS